MFGAGGGTSSYREIEETDLIVLWGSNARETHPIFFHHLLRGVRNGARLFAVDPRRTSSAEWADTWLGLDVGSDIALANAVGREIIAAGLANSEFIERATSDFEAYRAGVEPYTLEYAQRETGVPAEAIRELAHAFAKADRAMICWTLGITEHHNAVDNVLALINLALLTGHVGKYGSGLNPLRGQNNVQGGGDMGAIPDRLPGFQHVENDQLRAKFEQAWGVTIPDKRGRHLTAMCDAMACGDQRLLYVIGENPAQSEADQGRMRGMLESLEFLVVQDLFLTKTAELADVVLPAAAAWAESEGTVTNSERRVQRVRKAKEPPGDARDDLWIITELARRMGSDWGWSGAEDAWNELRTLSPMHAGMSYARLEALDGIQWPCYDENHPGELFLHSRLWEDPVPGMRAPFVAVEHDPPVDRLDDDFPIRLTTGRRLDSYNTGVQTAGYTSPLRRGESLDISPEDAAAYGLVDGERVCVTSRRGQVEAPIRIDESLRPGLTFMTLAFPGRGRHEPAHDRRLGPEVGHGRVQGHGHPDREAAGARTRRLSLVPGRPTRPVPRSAEVVRVVAQRPRVALGRAWVRQEQVEQDPHGLRWTAVAHERKGQEHARGPVLRVLCDGGLEDLDRLARFADVPERARQLDPGGEGDLGIETARQRSPVGLDGFRFVPGGIVGRPEVIERNRVVRSRREDDLQERDGLLGAPFIDQGLGPREVVRHGHTVPEAATVNAQRAVQRAGRSDGSPSVPTDASSRPVARPACHLKARQPRWPSD